ncbi:Molybdenum cofactor sulfurase, partial [Durusdinium trenchii]
VSEAFLRFTQLGRVVARYAQHPEVEVAKQAREIVEAWRLAIHCAPRPQRSASDDDSDVPSQARVKKQKAPARTRARTEKDSAGIGWIVKEVVSVYRGRRERFWQFTLQRPFGDDTWYLQVKVPLQNEKKEFSEIKELLHRMAFDLGAVSTSDEGGLGEEQLRALERLQRLEQRFAGSGVTESEARNALRLFERELSKANWSEEKFAKLKRQLAGAEEWSAADLVAECCVRWTEGKRRQAWFSSACARLAAPLGIESGYTENGGCCFVGPLSSSLGAALTATLVSHLGHLDLRQHQKQQKRISVPQFLQGFVDGALAKDRHLIWEKLFSLEDGEEAAEFCKEHLRRGFFDEDVDVGEEIRAMLQNMFGGSSSSQSSQDPNLEHSQPSSFAPFSGKAHRLEEDPPAKNSWALTFVSNLEVARSSRRRSREEAKRIYRWTFSAHAVKETKTDTASYTKGKDAGEKRKQQIESASGTAKRKFRKAPPLAITR